MFFLFITAVISLVVKNLALYLLCKHKKLRKLVASLALQQVKEVGTVTTQEEVTTEYKNSELYNFDINCFWSNDVCSSTFQKIKAAQWMHGL